MTRTSGKLSKPDQGVIEHERVLQRYASLRTAIRAIGWVACIWIVGQLLPEMAGKETSLALKLAILGDVKFIASLSLTGLASMWAVAERKLRHRKVEALQERIRELETKIDPHRTTSGLTTKGKTNPRDLQ